MKNLQNPSSAKRRTREAYAGERNAHFRKHILTLEDPIEFVFAPDKCLITQREIGVDVPDFEFGMKHDVREDRDAMLVGDERGMVSGPLGSAPA
jgi:twitching motility protein PilT